MAAPQRGSREACKFEALTPSSMKLFSFQEPRGFRDCMREIQVSLAISNLRTLLASNGTDAGVALPACHAHADGPERCI
jgi:hypothetical protein